MGFTQAQLAEAAGLTSRTVQTAENGQRVAAASARTLAAALGVPYMALLHATFEEIQLRLAHGGYAPLPPPKPWGRRDAEISQLSGALASGVPACCVAGSTGLGKTALARKVVAGVAEHFPGGVAWVNAYRATADHVSAWQLELAEILGFRGHLPSPAVVGREAFDHSFLSWFWAKPRLLVLDDVCEPWLLSRFLSETPVPKLLVTTSHRPIAATPELTPIELGPLEEEAALQLLGEYVGHEAIERESDPARRLVAACHCVPRSLQIAGRVLVRDRYLGLEAYAERIEQSPDEPVGLVGSQAADPSDRDVSFTTAFAQLRERLTPETWKFFGALSVFGSAPFNFEWATGVAREGEQAARHHMSELVAFYLVREEPSPHAEVRFSLDAQSQRAAEWAAGEHREALYAAWLQWAVTLSRQLAAGPAQESAERFAVESDTWRVGLDHFANAILAGLDARLPRTPEDVAVADTSCCPEGLVEILVNLAPALHFRMPPAAQRWLAAGLAVARALGDRRAMGVLYRLVGRWVILHEPDVSGVVSWCQSSARELTAAGEVAPALCQQFFARKISYFVRGPVEAAASFEETVDLARDPRMPSQNRASALNGYGSLLAFSDLEAAEAALDEALADLDSSEPYAGSVRSIALLNRGTVRATLGKPTDSAELVSAYEHAIDLSGGDDLILLRLAGTAKLLGLTPATPVSLDETVRRFVLLSVPPERALRRLLHLRELYFDLPRALGAPHAPVVPESRSKSLAVTGVFVNTPLDFEVGDPGILYPLFTMQDLLAENGLGYALSFIEQLCGRRHPVYQEIDGLRPLLGPTDRVRAP